jgi:hypothetical protein
VSTDKATPGESEHCEKCAQEVVARGRWWVLPSEAMSARVSFCPMGGIHDVDLEMEAP